MYIVTGGAGFIGSEIVRGLNDRGVTDILVVDDLTRGDKFANLADCTIADYMHKDELLAAIDRGALSEGVTALLHQGACANTMERNGRYMMENNFSFSKRLLGYALASRVPFVYASSASVYGRNRNSREAPEHECPLNVYAFSKLAFDQHVRRVLPDAESTVVGLRYFNVYGPREVHKERMASMVYQLYKQLRETDRAKLFEGTDGFGPGDQLRDFVFVGDVVRVNLHFAEAAVTRGICNVGTGAARTFNDVARTLIGLFGKGSIEYVPFPAELEGKYQSFTEADIAALRELGYRAPMTTLEEGVARSVKAWDRLPACP